MPGRTVECYRYQVNFTLTLHTTSLHLGKDRGLLSRKPVAPPWRHNWSLRRPLKNRGTPFWGSGDEHVDCEADPPCPLPFQLTSTHLVLIRAQGGCW